MGAFEKLAALRAAQDRRVPVVAPPKETPPMQTDLTLAEKIAAAAIEQAESKARAKGKSWRGAHVVFDNVNAALKAAGYPDPRATTAALAATGRFEIAPARGGARIYLAGTRPAADGNRNVAAILAAAGVGAVAAPTPPTAPRPGNGKPVTARAVTVQPDDVV